MRVVTGLAVAALLGGGCGGRHQTAPVPEAAAAPDGASCTGQRVVIVTNDWSQSVELFTRREDSSAGNSLGMLRPGERVEIPLPKGARSAYALPIGLISYIPPAMKQLVRLRYVCR